MARLTITATVAATLLLALPAGASAAQLPHPSQSIAAHDPPSPSITPRSAAGSGPVALAEAVAERYWSAVPCLGQIRLLTDMRVPRGLDPTTDGWVTFSSSLGPNDLQASPSTYTQCTISLARWQWPTRRAIDSDWNMFCLTVIHELGHLLGHPHSAIPGSVMAPVFSDESSVPQICRASRPAQGAARPHRH